MAAVDPLVDFEQERFAHGDQERAVFWQGTGPAVVVLTEMPGITPNVADFARRLVAAGFMVAMPDLFGQPGRPRSGRYLMSSFVKGCVSREFVAFATEKTSPITAWLRHLVGEADRRARAGGGPIKGVGVVGMCFTGGFALALAVDPLVTVPVLSQPSLPLPLGASRRRDLGLSPADLRIVNERAQADEICAIGLRFTKDPACPAKRFERLRSELGEAFIGVEIDSSRGNPGGYSSSAHSVLTDEYNDGEGPTGDAFRLVVEHLQARLS